MNTKRQVPARRLALVVMAAGVVTASPEFAAETVGEITSVRLSDILTGFSDLASSRAPKARK